MARIDPTINDKKLNDILQGCYNRMDVSYYKYGAAKKNFGEGRVDAAKSAELCLDKFFKTRNTEYLMDVINYSIYAIMFPLSGDYFKPTDSNESAGTVGTPINMERN